MGIEFTFAPDITDEVILKAFEGTNFGRTDYREFLAYSVLQKACGWHCGFTITTIMVELKLITPEHHRVTKLGRMFLTDCYKEPGQTEIVPAMKLPDVKPVIDKEEGNDIDYMEPSEVYELGKVDGFNKAIAEAKRMNGVTK